MVGRERAVTHGMGRVVCLGEAMVMLRPDQDSTLRDAQVLHRSVGGAEANVAGALAATGVPASWVSRLGRDPFGDYIEGNLRGRGVTVLAERDDHRPTGLYLKDSSPSGSTMHYYRHGSAAAAMDEGLWSDHDVLRALSRCSVVHTTGITAGIVASDSGLLPWLIHARDRFEFTLSVDLNWRPAIWRGRSLDPLMDLVAAADVLLLGADEAKAVFGDSDPAHLRQAIGERPTLVIKSDAHVATESPAVGPTVSVPALSVDVVEPVGAGDGFAAGYLTGLLSGDDARGRLRLGHLIAASVLSEPGDHLTRPPGEDLRRVALDLTEQQWRAIRVSTDGIRLP